MENKDENWRDVVGYEGIYMVSSLGNIKSLDRNRKGKKMAMTRVKGRTMLQYKAKTGYMQVGLSNDLKIKNALVHRVVAMAFIPNPLSLPCVDHINGDRTDNRVENLRWCTTKENMNYQMVRENISMCQRTNENCRRNQKMLHDRCKKPVIAVMPDGSVKSYGSIVETELDGFNHSAVSACCLGKYKTHRNCKFFYKESEVNGT